MIVFWSARVQWKLYTMRMRSVVCGGVRLVCPCCCFEVIRARWSLVVIQHGKRRGREPSHKNTTTSPNMSQEQKGDTPGSHTEADFAAVSFLLPWSPVEVQSATVDAFATLLVDGFYFPRRPRNMLKSAC